MLKQVKTAAGHRDIKRLYNGWPHKREAILDEALMIQQIPAPTFDEKFRAHYVEDRFQQIGLEDVFRDDLNNVYGRTPGRANGAATKHAVMVSAHLDTVFPEETDLTPRMDKQHGRCYAPGIGDNSLGIAAMLALAQQLTESGVTPSADIWWVATCCEEGLGDLLGMRRAIDQLGDQIGVGIVLEGIGLGHIYHAGLGARRLKIEVRGPGGHAWLHSRRPNAIHQLMKIGSALVDGIKIPDSPRSTLNIGLVDGGTSVNTRAATASMSVDIRSTNQDTLKQIEDQLTSIVEKYQAADLRTKITVVGDRPSARLPIEHPLVASARNVLSYIGCGAAFPEVGSTDANIPLAAGIPTVCIGITTGGNAHTMEEYINTSAIPLGMRQLTLLSLMAARHIDEWREWAR